MPTIYPSRWNDYTIRVVSSSLLRQIITVYSFVFNTDPLPYFYSTFICYNLGILPHRKARDRELHYDWQLVKSIGNEKVNGKEGNGSIKLHRFPLICWKNEAIKIGRIPEIGQYKIQMKISGRTESSPCPYIDIAEFTIRDKDEFGIGLIWIIVSAVIGAVVGAIARGVS